ncbi:MAG: patatin-like phospholipase family protein [Pseudacidovorax sp.]|nr:patatin-like phospholipase family protein [Pseudacidovorax sp.]
MASRRLPTPSSVPSTSAEPSASTPAEAASDGRTVRALVLQGGGALGAYQAGVYEGLSSEHHALDWVAGVSIGAINAALIAGNPPERRVERLREFWQLVSSAPGQQLPIWAGERRLLAQFSANAAVAMGILGFFSPRVDPTLLLGGAAPVLSYYDTSALKSTLERLVDFDRLNDDGIRVSVGAVNVRNGNSVYFDNHRVRIGPEHIMASGALPPGFPPVHIDGEDYWDGGIVSNTPLQYVLDEHERNRRLLVLQVDLFSAVGPMPTTLAEVTARQKDIQYSSRTRLNTDVLGANVNLQQALAGLLERLPPQMLEEPGLRALCQHLRSAPIDIVHLIHRPAEWEQDAKDYEFSRLAIDAHWADGLRDMRHSLAHPEWLQRQVQGGGVTTYDLARPDHARVRRPGTGVDTAPSA